MLKKITENPLLLSGIVVGAYFLLKMRPESKVSRTINEIREFGLDTIDTAVDAGTNIIQDVYDTGVDIFDIYDNEMVVDPDTPGLEGSANLVEEQEPGNEQEPGTDVGMGSGNQPDESEADGDGSGFNGRTSSVGRGFDKGVLSYSMDV